MGVKLHIEELSLQGFVAEDRHRVAEAMRAELARLIGARGGQQLFARPISLHALDGGAIEIKAGAPPRAAGRQIAQAIFRSLERNAAPAPGGGAGAGGRKR